MFPDLTSSTALIIISRTTCFFLFWSGEVKELVCFNNCCILRAWHTVVTQCVYIFNYYVNEWMDAIISELMYECKNGFFHLVYYSMDSAFVLLMSVPANILKAVS